MYKVKRFNILSDFRDKLDNKVDESFNKLNRKNKYLGKPLVFRLQDK